jgi:ABC-type polysaccharide/polyol phosphate export permease
VTEPPRTDDVTDTTHEPASPTAPAGEVEVVPPTAGSRPGFDGRWTVLRPESSRRPAVGDVSAWTLLRASATRDIQARYRESTGRGIWNLVQPVTMLLIYGWVFTRVFRATGEGLPYWSMAWTGIVCWQFVTHAVQMGMWSFIHQAGTLPKVWFPRIIVPLTPGTAALMDLGIGLVTVVVLAGFQGILPTETLIALPVPILVLLIWAAAGAIWVAPLAVFVRDLTTAIPLVIRLGFFATPIMYSAATLEAEGLGWLADWNPFAVVITAVRDVMLAGVWPDWRHLAIQAVAGLLVLGSGALYLRRVEHRLVDAL